MKAPPAPQFSPCGKSHFVQLTGEKQPRNDVIGRFRIREPLLTKSPPMLLGNQGCFSPHIEDSRRVGWGAGGASLSYKRPSVDKNRQSSGLRRHYRCDSPQARTCAHASTAQDRPLAHENSYASRYQKARPERYGEHS
jgi:hypothetical protein